MVLYVLLCIVYIENMLPIFYDRSAYILFQSIMFHCVGRIFDMLEISSMYACIVEIIYVFQAVTKIKIENISFSDILVRITVPLLILDKQPID